MTNADLYLAGLLVAELVLLVLLGTMADTLRRIERSTRRPDQKTGRHPWYCDCPDCDS